MDAQDVTLRASEIRALLAAGSGEAALLLLYLRGGGALDDAAGALGFDARQLDYASASLRQMGLLPERAPAHLQPSVAPAYSEQDIAREYGASSEFPTIVGEAQRRLGRVLSTEELKILLGIYRYLGLPAEVISLLIHYCISRSRARGAGRMPSLRMIEKEAYRWADCGIETMEQAAAYMQQELRRQSRAGRICEILQVSARLTPGEENYIRAWIEWGFDDEVIAKAYEKTRLSTGTLKWAYLNAILRSWHEQGFTTLQQVEAGDQKPAARAAAPKNPVQQHGGALSGVEKSAVERMLHKELFKEG